MALFESYDRRIDHINAVLKEYGINGIEDAKAICDAKGIDPYTMCKETQPICFENACWAYVVGAAIAIKKGCTNAAEAAEAIGIGLQAFCIAGSVADDRKVGIGMVTWQLVCFVKKQNVSHSWLVTNLSQQPKVLSRSLKWQTKFVKNRCVLF